jgi:hypothetical protein
MPLIIKCTIAIIVICIVSIYICSPTLVKALIIAEFKRGGFDETYNM